MVKKLVLVLMFLMLICERSFSCWGCCKKDATLAFVGGLNGVVVPTVSALSAAAAGAFYSAENIGGGSVMVLFSVSTICVGGFIGNRIGDLADDLRKALRRRAQPPIPLVPGRLNDDDSNGDDNNV